LLGIVAGLVARVKAKSDSTGRAIKALVGGWSPEICTALVPADDYSKNIAVECPKVLPLTWIAIKVADSGVTSGWEKEFTTRTGIKAAVKVTPHSLAEQVFAERTAQRLLSYIGGE
jgi:hypothetical protein